MADPFIAEIVMFGGNFAPRNWSLTDGQLLAISQNTALFSLLGTTYGGDGRTTYALPDLRSRMPMHAGRGPGLSNILLGARGGRENFVLTTAQMPTHTHQLYAERGVPSVASPDQAMIASQAQNAFKPYSGANGEFAMSTQSIGNAGGGQSVQKVSPFTAVNFIIAMYGVFPSRN